MVYTIGFQLIQQESDVDFSEQLNRENFMLHQNEKYFHMKTDDYANFMHENVCFILYIFLLEITV